jgi:tetratricopeptide (TPR) repeat protein|tara:strand:- start:270 stop:698 length:429 start_codon:yes stop_codon:yes gene_type:complete
MRYLILTIVFSLFSIIAKADKNNFFIEAKNLFENEKYEESKFLFQRNIVYNPKDASSYLYLAKIFKIEDDRRQEEKNINTTLLLDPKNEEALFLLIDMELERSNFSKADELSKDFKKICVKMCEKITSIESRLKDFERKDAS